MKKQAFIFFVLVLILSGCSSQWECPSCGRKTSDRKECPLCHTIVCDYCAEDDYFLEKYYNSGELQEYLEERGYVVFDEKQDAFELYIYGFASGYKKGSHGVCDDETEEAMGWDYNYLQKEYGGYGW